MKTPEKAPSWMDIISDSQNFPQELSSQEIRETLRKANQEYLYWDKFKYLPMPAGIAPETAWAYLKLNRTLQLKPIPATDKDNINFKYWLTDSILKDLHFIDHASGQILLNRTEVEAEQERYLINSIMEEAIASSQLEGAAVTKEQAKEMLRSGRKPKDIAEQMILNNYITIRKITENLQKPLTFELLNYIQSLITKDTLRDPETSGRFRNESERIEVADPIEGNVVYIPPPANELNERMKMLCDFANNEEQDEFIHPIVKAAILHFWLAYIHPYVDGNGRTARALFYWYMLKKQYWMFEFLSISRIILKAPAQYTKAYLYSEIDEQDLTYFITFHLRIIRLAIDELKVYLTKKQKEHQDSIKLLRNYPGLNHRQYSILRHAIFHPHQEYAIGYYKNVHGVVYQTARSDLLELSKKGLFDKIKKGKVFYFIPVHNLQKKLKI